MSRRIAKITRLLSRLTQRSSSNFMFAFVFLGAKQRKALETVYEFCRVVDDIVDEREPGEAGIERAREQLAVWSSEVASIWDDPYRESQGPQTDHADAPVRSGHPFTLAESDCLFRPQSRSVQPQRC